MIPGFLKNPAAFIAEQPWTFAVEGNSIEVFRLQLSVQIL